jgi:hypothetical protein
MTFTLRALNSGPSFRPLISCHAASHIGQDTPLLTVTCLVDDSTPLRDSLPCKYLSRGQSTTCRFLANAQLLKQANDTESKQGSDSTVRRQHCETSCLRTSFKFYPVHLKPSINVVTRYIGLQPAHHVKRERENAPAWRQPVAPRRDAVIQVFNELCATKYTAAFESFKFPVVV